MLQWVRSGARTTRRNFPLSGSHRGQLHSRSRASGLTRSCVAVSGLPYHRRGWREHPRRLSRIAAGCRPEILNVGIGFPRYVFRDALIRERKPGSRESAVDAGKAGPPAADEERAGRAPENSTQTGQKVLACNGCSAPIRPDDNSRRRLQTTLW